MEILRLNNNDLAQAKRIIGRYTNYNNFIQNKNRVYELTSLFKIKVCPYCNENYAYTLYGTNGKPLIRATIDHFAAQSSSIGKSLTLDFNNFVPACYICNCILKRNQISTDMLNPRTYDFNSIMKFKVRLNTNSKSENLLDYLDEDNIIVTIEPHNNIKQQKLIDMANKNIDVFKLKERYNNHKDEVIKILQSLKFYNKLKQTEIAHLLSTTNFNTSSISLSMIRRILFPDENCVINQTSLGKLKRDIIRQF